MKAVLPLLFFSVIVLAVPAQEGMMAPPAEAGQGGTMMMAGPSARIIPFTDLSTARLLAARGRTVLFFQGSGCPTCQAAMRELQAGAGRLGDLVVIVVDYDRAGELKKSYGVSGPHTWVGIDSSGRKTAIWNGGGVDELLRRIGP